MLIIFDTNVWISDLALASAAGSAVRFYLREQKARICLPEVVRLETEVNLRQSLTEHIGKIRSSHSQLLAVFGQLKEVVLPTQEDVESLISGVFSKVGVEIEEVPFTLDNARASLMRTVHKIVPSIRISNLKTAFCGKIASRVWRKIRFRSLQMTLPSIRSGSMT